MVETDFNQITSERKIVGIVDLSLNDNRIVEKLPEFLVENHPLYCGKSLSQITRIRGFILASFAKTYLPKDAYIYVLDELQNSREAYTTGAAAVAVRGLKSKKIEAANFLMIAFRNIRHRDDAISFDQYLTQWSIKSPYTTATNEILHSLKWLGEYAFEVVDQLEEYITSDPYLSRDKRTLMKEVVDSIKSDGTVVEDCCDRGSVYSKRTKHAKLWHSKNRALKTKVEDQDGRQTSFGRLIKGKTTVLSFFYTRCMNPNKCSLTITKLGQLKNMLCGVGLDHIQILAMSYDPSYDSADRIKSYAENRAFIFDSSSKLIRCDPEDFHTVSEYFNLGVNYTNQVVNHHRIELYILQGLKTVQVFENLQWGFNDVISSLKLIDKSGRSLSRRLVHYMRSFGKVFWSVLISLILAFFPKCPICWSAYLSLFGLSSMINFSHSTWMFDVFTAFLVVNVISVGWRAQKRRFFLPFYLSLTGALDIVLLGGYLWDTANTSILYLGVSLVVAGSLLNSISIKQINGLRWYLKRVS